MRVVVHGDVSINRYMRMSFIGDLKPRNVVGVVVITGVHIVYESAN